MIFGNPVSGYIVPYGEDRPPDQPNAFRVTQRFSDINPAYPELGQHGAIDLGNYRCGDPVFAAESGAARTMKDSAGALIVIIKHIDGWSTVYAHLNDFSIAEGISVSVIRGQQIGVVGSTGLGGICHLHFETKINGVKVDPWPLLEQNQEIDMKLPGKFVRHIVNRRSVLTVVSNFRAGPSRTEESLHTYGAGTGLLPIVEVIGEKIGDSDRWFGCFLWVSGEGYTFGMFHSSVLAPFTEVQKTGATDEQLHEAKRTGAAGAAGAAQAYADAL